MQTEYLKVDPDQKNAPALHRAVQLLNASELVAFPTETVYGLGAKVFDEVAVKKIYTVKNRPAGQALLVHISQIDQLSGIVNQITPDARLLMEEFWPGPLSIILTAHQHLPLTVTGGNTTVGLRMPSHPVAKNLIDIAGPMAATSANRSGRPSPITAEHVKADLNGIIRAVLDGGPEVQGIESTIIDLSREPYTIVRTGSITVEALKTVLGKRLYIKQVDSRQECYQTSFILKVALDEEDFQRQLKDNKQKALGVVYYDKTKKLLKASKLSIKEEYFLALNEKGSQFFSILRDAEQKNLEVLLMKPLPDYTSDSLRDRISRAARNDDKGV
ncbi:MAG TPA: L-threonylcarbamoyladenylate synthase [Syntrophomonadaceae bacterium]|nr:L-threonylcarbamoyladenylate synthase [Syntrophomonadaceae bacterium]HNX28140.1 L-threonylcarbamoyladenylate synthase [Syntrophomonadaceae bacterium]HPR93457.1 L-threonylcarbamoyladenylate synthase [Syntrophomonadaceae bacterium]